MRMTIDCYCCCSVAKSCLTLRPPGMQHARLLCPPLSPRVCSNACPPSRWCKWSHPLPPLSPFAFNNQVLSKASEGLSRAKKVTHFCSDGWISWKPPPQSCLFTRIALSMLSYHWLLVGTSPRSLLSASNQSFRSEKILNVWIGPALSLWGIFASLAAESRGEEKLWKFLSLSA